MRLIGRLRTVGATTDGTIRHRFGLVQTGRTTALFLVAALLAWTSLGCSDDPKGRGGGEADTLAQTGPDIGSDTGVDPDTFQPADTGEDGRRQPTDTSTDWDFGTPDTDAATPFEFREVVPPRGPVSGGNEVRLLGSGWSDETRIFFGSKEVEPQVSGEALVVTVPEGPSPGSVTVKAVQPSGESRALQDGYTYVQELSVDSVVPSRVPVEGGVEVEIRGDGFADPTAISVGGRAALRTERVDHTLVRAVVPPGQAGPADLRVTTPDDTARVVDGITYFAPIEIERVAPASGPTAGGQTVTVHARGISDDAQVQFDGRAATRSAVDPAAGTVTVKTPPNTSGLADVTVQSGGGAAILKSAYLYEDGSDPTLAAVHPDFGSTAGGTEVLLVGRGLDGAAPAVKFGASGAKVLEAHPTWMRVETPAGRAGAVDVVVTDGGSEVARLDDGFDYRQAVSIDKVQPTSGPVAGGTTVELSGSGFTGVQTVEIGGLPASFSVKSDTRIQATTPAHGAGTVDVLVERDGLEARLKDGFEYRADLEVWGFSPMRGAMAGGTWVEVRGQGFTASTTASLDGASASDVTVRDPHTLTLYTPSHQPGEATLRLERGSAEAEGPYPFEYFNPGSRYGGASGGPVDGSVNVTVLARGAGPIPGAFVMLSTRPDTPYTGTTDQNGQLTLSGPDVLGPQTVTATAKGFSSTTVQTVDAENITVFLSKMEPEMGNGGGGGGDGPPTGVIHGSVKAPRKSKNPGEQVTWEMAVVETTVPQVEGRSIDPGDNSVVLGNGSYEIKSRIGDVAVVALCGSYTQQTDTFDPQYMGVKRYLNVSEGARVKADIVCDIPLDETLDVKLVNPVFAPGGPDTNRAEVWWDFGFEGVYEAPSVGRGLGRLVRVPDQPALKGPLSDVTMTVIGGSFTGRGSPSTQMKMGDIADLSRPVVLPALVDVPEPVSPTAGGVLKGREIRFQAAGPYYPDFWSIYFLNKEGRPFWRHVIPGDENVVKFPEFPDFSELPEDQRPSPMAKGRVYMIIMGIDALNANFDNFSYRDLGYSRWRGYSINRWSFQIP